MRHFALTASVEVIHRRLRSRLASVLGRLIGADETWAMQQAERCVAALQDSRFATHLPTDGLSVDEVVEQIAHDLNLPLEHSRLGATRYQLRRVGVGIRHIRF